MEVKLTEEELSKFRSLTDRFESVKSQMADTSFHIEMLKRKKLSLVTSYDMSESSLNEFKQELAEKYKKELGSRFSADLSTGTLKRSDD